MFKSPAILCCALAAALSLCACRKEQQANTSQPSNANAPLTNRAVIKISSTVFPDGALIPRPYTCDGPNVSPSLRWESVPTAARTLAIICDDPDAPAKTWVHWVLYNLPADTKGLIENVPKQEKLAGGGLQGLNDFRQFGYDGPCPPSGTHRYFFKLYALDVELPLESGATKEQLLQAMEGHIVGEGQLMGKYQR
jgi:Raf kinase inhibitor-like YbhB/YbcL family protein